MQFLNPLKGIGEETIMKFLWSEMHESSFCQEQEKSTDAMPLAHAHNLP